MSKRHDVDEEWAIRLLEQIVRRSVERRDALPGSAVKKIKDALTLMKKRRKKGVT